MVILLLRIVNSNLYYVIPDDRYSTNNNTHVLQHYLNNTNKYFTSHTQLQFLYGRYFLNNDLIINNVTNFSLVGYKIKKLVHTVIRCNSPTGIVVVNSSNVTISNIEMYECGNNYSYSVRSDIYKHGQVVFSSLLIISCSSFTSSYFKSFCYQKLCSFNLINVIGFTALSHLSSHCLAVWYYDGGNDTQEPTLNNMHTLYIDDFKPYSSLNGIYVMEIQQHGINYLINLTITKLRLTRSIFNIFISIECLGCSLITFSNCRFAGAATDTMYSYCDKEEDDCKQIIYTKEGRKAIKSCAMIFYHIDYINWNNQHLENQVLFTDCQFADNSKVAKLLDFYLENWKTMSNCVSIHIVKCMFYENKNTQMLTAQNKIHFNHFYRQSLLIVINNTVISSNVYRNRDAIFFDKIKVVFERVLIVANTMCPGKPFANGFIKAKDSYVQFSGYNEVYKNHHLKFIVESPAIYILEHAELRITSNQLLYSFLHPILLESDQIEMCVVQYISERGNLDKEFQMGQRLNYTIIYTRNYMPKIPPRSWMHCSWGPNTAFLTSKPLDVNQNFIHYDHPLYMRKQVCLCSQNKSHSCYSQEIGPVFPGQRVSLYFLYDVDDSDPQRVLFFRYNIAYTSGFECRSDNMIALELPFNECINVNFRVKHSNEHWCELAIFEAAYYGMGSLEMYTIQLRPCPVGFTLHLEGVCQCDPILSSHIPSLTNCNIDKQTIPRPANSWITADTVNGSHYYHVSLQCPQDYCLPHLSHLNLTTPDSQCQHNRIGILCGECPENYSAILGSFRCKQCSNISLLIIIPIGIAGLVLVVLLFTLNLTVTDGDINSFLFYANIISINSNIFFPTDRSVMYTFISLANLDLGIETCFYNGMDDYAKMWLQLAFPVYLIFIALSLTIASHCSIALQKINARGALPVLATVILLSYTKLLLAISNVLFFYSKITHLPSSRTTLVCYMNPNVQIFGVKFTILFTVCLILFLLLILFNILLFFAKKVASFKVINFFKSLLDTYQSPYKDKHYYWAGLQLLIRPVFLGLSTLDKHTNLQVCILVLIIMVWLHEKFWPFKNNRANITELVLLINVHTAFIVSYFTSSNNTAMHVLVAIAMCQLGCVVFFHVTALFHRCTNYVYIKQVNKMRDVLFAFFRFYKK